MPRSATRLVRIGSTGTETWTMRQLTFAAATAGLMILTLFLVAARIFDGSPFATPTLEGYPAQHRAVSRVAADG